VTNWRVRPEVVIGPRLARARSDNLPDELFHLFPDVSQIRLLTDISLQLAPVKIARRIENLFAAQTFPSPTSTSNWR
jgi:hypothetical protein